MMIKRAVFIVHRTKPGRREQVLAVWQKHLQPSITDNIDHLAYHYGFDPADKDVIRVFQLYASANAAAAFLKCQAYAEYLNDVEPLLLGAPDVTVADQVWAKG